MVGVALRGAGLDAVGVDVRRTRISTLVRDLESDEYAPGP